MASLLATQIVEAVLHDLRDRRGIKQELFHIEDAYPEVYQEIQDTLALKIDKVIFANKLLGEK